MTQKGAIVRNSNDSPLASQKRVGQLQNEEKYLSIQNSYQVKTLLIYEGEIAYTDKQKLCITSRLAVQKKLKKLSSLPGREIIPNGTWIVKKERKNTKMVTVWV